MKLSLNNRIHITSVLPAQGDFVTMTLKGDIVEKTKLTQKEITDWEVKTEGGNIQWNSKKEKEVDVEYTKLELDFIVKQLKELDSKKELNDSTLSLYQLFVK